MGLPGFSNISFDILLMLILNIAVSLRQIKHMFLIFMQVIGLLPTVPRSSEIASGTELMDDFSFCSSLTSAGLSTETLQALPLAVYTTDQHMGVQGDVDCCVCLQEFHKGDEVRLLPFCRHLFHRSCLDRWLEQEQYTCPVCRSSVIPDEVCQKRRQREQEVAEDLVAWFSSPYGSALQGLWCYHQVWS